MGPEDLIKVEPEDLIDVRWFLAVFVTWGIFLVSALLFGYRNAMLISGAAFVLLVSWPIYRHQRLKKEGLRPDLSASISVSIMRFSMLPFLILWFGLIILWAEVFPDSILLIPLIGSGVGPLLIGFLVWRIVSKTLRKAGLLPKPQAPEPTPNQTATHPTPSFSYKPRSYSGYSRYPLTDDAFARRQRQREIVTAAIAILGLIPPEELAKWSGMGGSGSEGSGGEDSSGEWDSFRYL